MSHEKFHALDLVAQLAGRFGPGSKVAQEVPDWIEYLTNVECPERPRKRPGAPWWSKIRTLLDDLRQAQDTHDCNAVEANVERFGSHFALDPLETRLLAFFAFYQVFDMFEHVVDQALRTKEVTMPLLAAGFCGVDQAAIRMVLRPGGRLSTSGLLKRDTSRRFDKDMPYALSQRLAVTMPIDVSDIDELIDRVFRAAPPPVAEWSDFAGLGADADLIRDLMERALATKTAGVNILLYGPSGTGKTELCKVLAQHLGARLRTIGETDDDGEEPSRHDRLTDLGLAGRMLASRRDTILLLDEMEDLFGGARSAFFTAPQMSKVFTNRLLETNPIPTLWTTNSIEACDPAFLRRITFSVEMRRPSGLVRQRIWERLAARQEIGIDPDNLARLAAAHDHPPALVADAMHMTHLGGGGGKTFIRMLGASGKLMNGGLAAPPAHHAEVAWMSPLANPDVDLIRLEARLIASSTPPRVSFCLDGPAGTGKSAWARHLALRLGMPVVQKRGSDLMSIFVGGTEKAIADAFSEARADDAMLIFDEADSLLADRRNAVRNWEVSQVNEMLTWMESHHLPFVCTTNLADKLDPATQRRFTFRVRFDWLRADQLPQAWTAYFDAAAPAAVSALDHLSAGDFANVARRMRAMGENTPAEILRELTLESHAKDGNRNAVGFGR
jgi:AAA+ superfamily predicted ATPase